MGMGFSDINIPDATSNIDSSPGAALTYLGDRRREYEKILMRSLDRWMLSTQEARVIGDMIGRRQAFSNGLASNMALRASVCRKLISIMGEMAAEHPARKFYLLTLLSDRWNTYSRDTYLYLGDMLATFDEAVPRGGLDGWFGLVEVQTLDESRRDLGRIMMAHGHAIAWTDRASFAPRRSAAAIAEHPLLFSASGADVADFSRRDDTHPSNLAAYIFKPSSVAARRIPDRSKEFGFRLGPTALPPVCAVRQTEILSHMYLEEMMFCGGGGIAVRDTVLQHVDDMIHRIPSELSVEFAARFWPKLRKRSGNNEHYYPVEVRREQNNIQNIAPIYLLSESVIEFLQSSSGTTID